MVNTRIIQSAAEAESYDTQAEYTDRVVEIKRQLLQEYYIQKKIDEVVTDEALMAEYATITADFKAEDEVKARHILLAEEEQAKDVISKLDAGGDFVELAKELSTGPSGPTGGDLGYFVKGRMVPEFSEVAFTLEKGTYSKTAVKTQFGWHVILVEDRRATKAPAFEGMRKQLKDNLSSQTVTSLLETLKASATVDIITAEEEKSAAEAKEDVPAGDKKEN
ncbi:MAG: peptidylprolyl isomerase [Gammaproteobacteria bacterium]|nr:MAG: peptidylprolyl isomerase [Gammaproteobacteria bacterium]